MILGYKSVVLAASMYLFCMQALAQKTFTDTIPFGGNAYTDKLAEITDSGLVKWTHSATMTSVYFRAEVPQTVNLSLRLQVPDGESIISLSAGNILLKKEVSCRSLCVVDMGKLVIAKPGYIRLGLKGIYKTGRVFANVSDLIIQYQKKDTGLVYVKNGSSFHFGRRGPSVHLNFMPPDDIKDDIRWFYNELYIPAGQDKPGSYFMADGFGEGYFGMQVNSDTERRVLFSVWSPYDTENPEAIPDSQRIVLLKKGMDVHTGEFGNEGSGGQSYLRYKWKAGRTYAFLLGAQPDSVAHTTTYSAYFKDLNTPDWQLIAIFKRPQTVTYLTHLYSFLENFIPETGDQQRMGWYQNQWVMNRKGTWRELTKAKFTYDATARSGYRKDYAGGAEGNHFYLRNDGFFNNFTKPYQVYTRKPYSKPPVIDLGQD